MTAQTFAEIQKETGMTDSQMIQYMVEATGMEKAQAGFILGLEKGEIDGDVIGVEETTKERIMRVAKNHR